MLSWFKTRAADRRTAINLYGATVTQARDPAFFAELGIEDTPEGRTSILIIHIFLVLNRLNEVGSARASKIGQYLSEAYVSDIDDCLREMGVGDMSVPKKVKRAAQALGERCMVYQKAMGASTYALAEELKETVPGLAGVEHGAWRLAVYMSAAAVRLSEQNESGILAGTPEFPPVGQGLSVK